ncbi:unnamed protein product [Leptidea sinapis]|uniref:Uncharacterized protein n=1 Tax=Leptidea sinapis TaxID=189913 RepID=A0A5E4R1T8_9NEOP|nr:unnamed protein product [Leptidea sinapis]
MLSKSFDGQALRGTMDDERPNEHVDEPYFLIRQIDRSSTKVLSTSEMLHIDIEPGKLMDRHRAR